MKLSTPLTTDSEHWITMSGSHLLIDGEGAVLGGAGGKFAGKKLDRVTKKGPDRTAKKGGSGRHASVKEGHNELSSHVKISRETEKAVGIENPIYKSAVETAKYDVKELSYAEREALRNKESLIWLPKSQISTHEGTVTGMAPWLAKKQKMKTREGEAEEAEYQKQVKSTNNTRANFARAQGAGIPGISPYTPKEEVIKKLREHGLQVDE